MARTVARARLIGAEAALAAGDGGDAEALAEGSLDHDPFDEAALGGPLGAAAHIRASLADDGTWLLVEPMAVAGLENNVNPVSRIFYAGSVGICTPAAEAQSGGYALGNQESDARWGELLGGVGFSRFRRAAENPFNRVFEVSR